MFRLAVVFIVTVPPKFNLPIEEFPGAVIELLPKATAPDIVPVPFKVPPLESTELIVPVTVAVPPLDIINEPPIVPVRLMAAPSDTVTVPVLMLPDKVMVPALTLVVPVYVFTPERTQRPVPDFLTELEPDITPEKTPLLLLLPTSSPAL